MPYATAQFLQDPLGFMQNNIIVPHHSDIWMYGYSANAVTMIRARKDSLATGAPTIKMKHSAAPSVTGHDICLPPPWMAAHLV